ncbi:MAG: lipocalin family protein [Flavobacteriaceae bacterium]|nr:lipocalin family protein [Flavobacteriaceae bacterium]
MKKLLLFSTLLGILFTSSCAKDDDISDETAIIGTWTLVSYFIEGTALELDDCDRSSSITYDQTYNYSKNTYQTISNDCKNTYQEIGLWKFLGKNVFTTTPVDGEPYKFTVGFSGNTYTTEDLVETNGLKKLHRLTYTKNN